MPAGFDFGTINASRLAVKVTGLSTMPGREEPLRVQRRRRGEDVGRGAVLDLGLEHVRAGEAVLLSASYALNTSVSEAAA